MFKCVYEPCGDAEYIYLGKSLCKFHFKKEVKEAVEAEKRAEKRRKDMNQPSGAEG